MKNKNINLGILLIFLGLIFLFENLNIINIRFIHIWPGIIFLGGLGFLFGYFKNRKNSPMLLPAAILLTYGGLFAYCNTFGWDYMEYLWPIFLIGPGLGFILMYLPEKKDKGLLVPGGILLILGFFFMFSYLKYIKYWPAALIFLGFFLIYMGYKEKQKREEKTNNVG